VIQLAIENTGEALAFAQERLVPRLVGKNPVVLDFRNIPILTQSFLHALLYEPLRVAWALKTEIYVVNAKPAVRSNLELLQNYALGG
jgi:anti-anti-sigma regulatory factor